MKQTVERMSGSVACVLSEQTYAGSSRKGCGKLRHNAGRAACVARSTLKAYASSWHLKKKALVTCWQGDVAPTRCSDEVAPGRRCPGAAHAAGPPV